MFWKSRFCLHDTEATCIRAVVSPATASCTRIARWSTLLHELDSPSRGKGSFSTCAESLTCRATRRIVFCLGATRPADTQPTVLKSPDLAPSQAWREGGMITMFGHGTGIQLRRVAPYPGERCNLADEAVLQPRCCLRRRARNEEAESRPRRWTRGLRRQLLWIDFEGDAGAIEPEAGVGMTENNAAVRRLKDGVSYGNGSGWSWSWS